MSPLIFLHFANLFFAGMLAGIETGVHCGLGAPPKALSEQSQILLRQALVLKLRTLVPIYFVPAVASAVALTAIDGSSPGLWLRYAGLMALLIWIIIRVVRTIPINGATALRLPFSIEKLKQSLSHEEVTVLIEEASE